MKKNQIKLMKKMALSRVRKHFPQVTKVIDARESKRVTVIDADTRTGRRKDPANCALARACTRQGADGAIINIGTSYIINGEVATRYKTSIGVGREITSFDRHQDFAPGNDYLLSKVGPSQRIGANAGKTRRGGHSREIPKGPLAIHKNHHTSRIRVARVR